MRKIGLVLLSIFIVMDIFSQQESTDRQPVAAGRFYSANRETLTNDIRSLFEASVKTPGLSRVRAVISPHAGYIYSGKVAASAYSAIDKKTVYKNIFVIGSSHIMAFEGASVYSIGDFITPLGKVTVNREIAGKLTKEKYMNFPVTAHAQEHSLEVQLPLIQYYFKDTPPVIPIIIGTNSTSIIKKIAEELLPYFTPDNLFVISSDFSHYPSWKTANTVDEATANSIISGDPRKFIETLKKNSEVGDSGLVTSMCGWTSGLLLLYLAGNSPNLEFKKVDYTNSGDSKFGSKDEVVGYNAIVLSEKSDNGGKGKSLADEIKFSDTEKDFIISLARDNIRSLLYDKKRISVSKESLPPILMQPLGAFVTLKIDGALRGCIGRFVSSEPLYEVILESSQSSAFEDPRFSPLTKEDFKKTDIEITVLGPLKKINSIKEIVLGKHGIYIKKDFRSGTMLPQVAIENNWSVEEFLGYTSRDKAGLGWDGWKNADLYIYEGIVLEEKQK